MTTPTSSIQPYTVQTHFKPQNLDGLSDKLLEQHWKLYEGYVTNTNTLLQAVAEASSKGIEINKPNPAELQRRLGFEFNGMVLHEYYFGGMKAGSKFPSNSSPLARAMAGSFGSTENWKKQFMEIGKMRGVGWTITYLDPATHRLVNVWVSDHEVGHIAGFIPLLIMDCWEHAFVTDFGATADGRASYVQTFFRNINWEVHEERWEAAEKGLLLPRVQRETAAATKA